MTITYEQEKKTQPIEATLKVIGTTDGMQKEIYLHNSTTSQFESVANVAELTKFPIGSPQATFAFYLLDNVNITGSTLVDLETQLDDIVTQMTKLDGDFAEFANDGDWNRTVTKEVTGS